MTVRTAAYRDRINQRGLGPPKLRESSSPQVPGSVHLCFVQGEPMNSASVTKRLPRPRSARHDNVNHSSERNDPPRRRVLGDKRASLVPR